MSGSGRAGQCSAGQDSLLALYPKPFVTVHRLIIFLCAHPWFWEIDIPGGNPHISTVPLCCLLTQIVSEVTPSAALVFAALCAAFSLPSVDVLYLPLVLTIRIECVLRCSQYIFLVLRMHRTLWICEFIIFIIFRVLFCYYFFTYHFLFLASPPLSLSLSLSPSPSPSPSSLSSLSLLF